MPRLTLVATLVLSSSGALAQGGDLASVTMRVLDDISALDAVILELDASPGQSEQGAERGGEAAAGQETQRTAPVADGERDDTRLPDNGEGQAPAVPPAR